MYFDKPSGEESLMTIFSHHLDTLGGSGGTGGAGSTAAFNAILDWSSTAQDFWIQPESGHALEVHHLTAHIEDGGTFIAAGYGSTSAAVANGVSILLQRGGVDFEDLTDGHPITHNADWYKYSFDVDYVEFGSGNNFLKVRWAFTEHGETILLKDSRSDRFVVRINDDFRFLVDQEFVVQGRYLGKEES